MAIVIITIYWFTMNFSSCEFNTCTFYRMFTKHFLLILAQPSEKRFLIRHLLELNVILEDKLTCVSRSYNIICHWEHPLINVI